MRVFLTILFACFYLIATPVLADDSEQSIEERAQAFEVTALLKFLVAQEQFPLSEIENFNAYMAVTACDIFENYYNNDFEWTKMHEELAPALERELETQKNPIFIVEDYLRLDRYNFSTKSFDLAGSSFKAAANTINIKEFNADIYCPERKLIRTTSAPRRYDLKFNTPVSIYRIPMSKELADQIIHYTNDYGYAERGLFLKVFIEMDGASYSRSVQNRNVASANIFGNIVRIDVYIDPDRKHKIKTLTYGF